MTPNLCTPTQSSNNATPKTTSEGAKTAITGSALLACVLFVAANDQVALPESPSSSIPQWRLLAFDDFNETREGSNNEFSKIGENQVLGGLNATTQTLNLQIPESNYVDFKVNFDFYFIDSWDDEFASIEAQVHYADGTTGRKKTLWKEAGHAHFFPSNIAGNIYRDYRATVSAILDGMNPNKPVTGVELTFKAEIGSLGSDESWAVDNLEVYGR